MNLLSLKSSEISYVFRIIAELQLQGIHNVIILLLEHLGINALGSTATFQIDTIIIHMIDEEQRQALDAHLKQFALFLDMRKDGFTNLMATHIDLIHPTYHLTFMQHGAIQQTDSAVVSIDTFHTIAISVFLQAARLLIDIKAVRYQFCHLLHAAGAFLIIAYASLRITRAQHDTLQIEIAIGSRSASLLNALY